MSKTKLRPHQKSSSISGTGEGKRAAASLIDDNFFLISFRQLDRSQGNSFEDWDRSNQLHKAMDVLQGYCCGNLIEQTGNKKFTIYRSFPPAEKTNYTHPRHVPEDASWARIHVDGLQCIIGHVVRNVFYVVFLDGDHTFWKSELKHT